MDRRKGGREIEKWTRVRVCRRGVVCCGVLVNV
jgi:hypothetical protein